MKRKHGVFFGFAVLLVAAMFTLAGCGDGAGGGGDEGGGGGNLPTTNGTFTLTGASAYNGKYAYAQGSVTTGFVYGGTGKSTEWKGILIQNGTVELPMYYKSTSAAALTAYSGSDTITATVIGDSKLDNFMVYIMPTADAESYVGQGVTHFIGWDTVTFSNGSVTKDATEGRYY
jgi:hypothetical protein